MNTNKRANGWALLPFILFLVLFLYGFPLVTAIIFGCVMAFFYGKGKISEKFSVFARGVADEGVIIMLVMGLRAGILIGSSLLFTIGGTLLIIPI